jgi:hypothetical protein
MKAGKMFILVGILCTGLGFGGFGCATEDAASGDDPAQESTSPLEESTSEVDQEVGSCSAWENCYAFCRRIFKCTTPAGCNSLTNCLNNCDASFPHCTGG